MTGSTWFWGDTEETYVRSNLSGVIGQVQDGPGLCIRMFIRKSPKPKSGESP